jgi:hypothetical protein
VKCNKKLSIKLKIGGEWYKIPMEAFTQELGNGECALWLMPNEDENHHWNLGGWLLLDLVLLRK